MADTPRLGWRPRFLLLTTLVALLCDRAPAQTVLYWNSTNGGSGGNWSNTNNWVGSVTPTNGDTLVFTQGSGTLNNDLSRAHPQRRSSSPIPMAPGPFPARP